ncbi:MAG: hypothetical protein KatS3mg132_249 [Limisphaera sp.]|nr:MAG: hypothetical protein KatS3mg132_249 [Limisphaera sp.]
MVPLPGLGRYPPPYDTGFTNVIYEVSEWQEVGSLALPAKSRLRVLAPPGASRSGTDDLATVAVGEVHVTATHGWEGTVALPPAIKGVAIVYDYRISSEAQPGWFVYTTTNRILEPAEFHTARLGSEPAWPVAQLQWDALQPSQRLAEAEARQARRAVTYRWILITSSLALALAIGWALYRHRISQAGRAFGHKPPLS